MYEEEENRKMLLHFKSEWHDGVTLLMRYDWYNDTSTQPHQGSKDLLPSHKGETKYRDLVIR